MLEPVELEEQAAIRLPAAKHGQQLPTRQHSLAQLGADLFLRDVRRPLKGAGPAEPAQIRHDLSEKSLQGFGQSKPSRCR